ncbi:MAG: hypothetical protein LBQ77_00225 [Treponema sp.]|nr:hypothetical protein [Treponema sp.]
MITVTGCNDESTDSDPTPNTDPKVLVITNVNPANFDDSSFAHLNLGSLKAQVGTDPGSIEVMLGIFPAGTAKEDALAQTGFVAGTDILPEYSETKHTATFELWNTTDETEWTGSGTYDIYIAIDWEDSGSSSGSTLPKLVYKKTGVAFNAATTSVDAKTFESVSLGS